MDVASIPSIGKPQVWHLADVEYSRLIDLVRSVDPDKWSAQTDCDRWDVRALCLHILGALEAQASPRELIHQFRRGLPLNKKIPHNHWVDGITELQVRERAHLHTRELVEAIARIAPKAIRGRRTVPPPIRWVPIPFGPPIGWKPLTYLLHMGFTRDIWMHRIDLARAIGSSLVLSPEHDGRIVSDLVAEWARIHRQPFQLTLDGPAGGEFHQGNAGEVVRIDAIEFARTLAGRAEGAGVLRNPLPL